MKPARIHEKPIPQEEYKIDQEDKTNYLEQLEDLDLNDDFDVDLDFYAPSTSFKQFVMKPFSKMDNFVPFQCKIGIMKLPKKIYDRYIVDKRWNPENYSPIQLLALIYLHYYADCDEWKDLKTMNNITNEITEALNIKKIDELFHDAFAYGDIKLSDFEKVVDADDYDIEDITEIAD
jgi:hypothetical protein